MKYTITFLFILPFIFTQIASSQVNESLQQGDSMIIIIEDYVGILNWESSSDNSQWDSIPGAIGDSLLIIGGTDMYYRGRVIAGLCPTYYSDYVYVNIFSYATISTTEASSIVYNGASSGGSISDDGGVDISVRGVCWNTTGTPTTDDSKTEDGTGTGEYTSSLAELSPVSTYYVRAYATNEAGVAYGEEVSFTTPAALPTISTYDITSITDNSSNTGGAITDDGGAVITARGVCWNTTGSATVEDSKTEDGEGEGEFSSSLSDLSPVTMYYIRAYAENEAGIAYGDEKTFRTLAALATITTTKASSIMNSSASSGGSISDDGGADITARGVCWNTTGNPTISERKTSDDSGTGEFSSSITGLTLGASYYVRAYATNIVGTSYGNEISFTTIESVPTLSTTEASSITLSTAKSGGNVTNEGGVNVISRGVCWSTLGNPTIELSTKTADGTGVGSFTSSIFGLAENTTYYVRAYATNLKGTAYGSVISFKTQSSVLIFNPSLTYGTVVDIDGNIYKTIAIGTQIWMAENLRAVKYRNGDIIGTTSPATLDISSETTPKYQWAYDSSENNTATYGRLYTWYAVTDSRNICPTGWHLPTDADWQSLVNFLGGEDVAGGKLKETGISHWNSPNTGASNETGFTSIPNGARNPSGSFESIGYSGHHWNSSTSGIHSSGDWYMFYNTSRAVRTGNPRAYGFAVRCIKD